MTWLKIPDNSGGFTFLNPQAVESAAEIERGVFEVYTWAGRRYVLEGEVEDFLKQVLRGTD